MQVLKEEIRNRIKQAALELFAGTGYLGTTVSDIADRAGISVGNVYKYYKNKQDLFDSLVQPVYDKVVHCVKSRTQQKVDSSITDIAKDSRILGLTEELLQLFIQHRLEALILLSNTEGTGYENLKEHFVAMLEENMLDYITQSKGKNYLSEHQTFFLHIIYENIANFVLAIARKYSEEEDIRQAVKELFTYHFYGLSKMLGFTG